MLSSLSRNNTIVFWSLLAWGVGEGLWWYLLPIYIGSLGADSVQIGFALSIGMALMTISFIPSGWLTDRMSRRRLMILGWLLGPVSVLLVSLAQSWEQAIPGLILYNLSAFCMPAISAYITAEVRPGQSVRQTYTLVFAGFTIGTMISPPIGGWLGDLWGLRAVFVLSSVVFAISAALIFRITGHPVARPVAGQATPSLLRNRLFVGLCVLFFFMHLAGHLGIPLAPNFLQDVRQLPLSWIGILGSANGLGAAILTVGLGRWPRGRVAGLMLAQAALVVYSVLLLATAAIPLLALAFFLRGGLGALRQLAGARLGEMMPASSMGFGFGIFSTVVFLAFTVSPYLAGWLHAANPAFPFIASIVLFAPVMIATVLFAGRGSDSQ